MLLCFFKFNAKQWKQQNTLSQVSFAEWREKVVNQGSARWRTTEFQSRIWSPLRKRQPHYWSHDPPEWTRHTPSPLLILWPAVTYLTWWPAVAYLITSHDLSHLMTCHALSHILTCHDLSHHLPCVINLISGSAVTYLNLMTAMTYLIFWPAMTYPIKNRPLGWSQPFCFQSSQNFHWTVQVHFEEDTVNPIKKHKF